MIWYPLGVFFLGIIIARASGRFLDNVFKAHRKGLVGYYSIGAAPESMEVGRWKTPSDVQTLLFSRNKFSPSKAKQWAQSRGFRYGNEWIDITDDYVRIRQADPSEFRTFRTIEFTPDIKAVIGPRS